jgi:hypothetical protein
MAAQTITLANNGNTTFTITNISFNTPLGISHSANLSNFAGGISNFTGTEFTTVSTMTSGTVLTFTLDHSYVSTSTGVKTGSVLVTGTNSISKTITTQIVVSTTGTIKVPADTTFVHKVLPYGTILMWSGTVANIPTGWQLCDGSNSTPDLRDKFIIGATQDDGGVAKTNITGSLTQTGGTKDAIVVDHSHTATADNPGDFITGSVDSLTQGGGGSVFNNASGDFSLSGTITPTAALSYNSGSSLFPTLNISAGDHTHSITVNSTGTTGTNQNLPPYYALAYIMKMTDENDTVIA